MNIRSADLARAYRACIAFTDRDNLALDAVLGEVADADQPEATLGLVLALVQMTASVVYETAARDREAAGRLLRVGLANVVANAMRSGDDLDLDTFRESGVFDDLDEPPNETGA
jgi:hypothetical protein